MPPEITEPGWLVFTDLDGTLLDHRTYSFQAAKPALQRLRERGIPVIAVSSKTRSEILPLLDTIGLSRIFVSENGSGIFIARALGLNIPQPHEKTGDYDLIRLGQPYRRVVALLQNAAAGCSANIRGFADLSVEEIAGLTGLDPPAAARARAREFSEPFICEGPPETLACLQSALISAGLVCLQGGRFLHALGRCDKGSALRTVLALYRHNYPHTRWQTVALGDSPNDIDLLDGADRPVIVMRPDRTYCDLPPDLQARTTRAPGIGPAGWNKAVLDLLV